MPASAEAWGPRQVPASAERGVRDGRDDGLCETVVGVTVAVEALDRDWRRVAGQRCSGMVARVAVGARVVLEGAHRTQGDAAVAADREREVEIKIVGLGVGRQRVQVVDFARDVVAVLVVVDVRKLALVAAALVLAVGRMRARGAAVADLDAAERAVCAGAESRVDGVDRGQIGNPSCAQPICEL